MKNDDAPFQEKREIHIFCQLLNLILSRIGFEFSLLVILARSSKATSIAVAGEVEVTTFPFLPLIFSASFQPLHREGKEDNQHTQEDGILQTINDGGKDHADHAPQAVVPGDHTGYLG